VRGGDGADAEETAGGQREHRQELDGRVERGQVVYLFRLRAGEELLNFCQEVRERMRSDGRKEARTEIGSSTSSGLKTLRRSTDDSIWP